MHGGSLIKSIGYLTRRVDDLELDDLKCEERYVA